MLAVWMSQLVSLRCRQPLLAAQAKGGYSAPAGYGFEQQQEEESESEEEEVGPGTGRAGGLVEAECTWNAWSVCMKGMQALHVAWQPLTACCLHAAS